MSVGISSRPSSRRQRNAGCPKPATSHKYSTISAAVLNQLLPSPKKSAKSNDIVKSRLPNPLKNTPDKQTNDNAHINLPSILTASNTAYADSRDTPGQGETHKHNQDILLELVAKLPMNSPTPADEFFHNKVKSTKGCFEIPGDEAEKRRRQKAVLKQQIEEKRRLQELREQQRQQMIMEEEERVKRELALLQQRWDKEIEREKKQVVIRSESIDTTSQQDQPVQVKTKDVVIGQTRSKTSSGIDPFLVELQEPIQIATASPHNTCVDNTFGCDKAQVHHGPGLFSDHKGLENQLASLTELCKKLLNEQQQMKAELEDQKRQTRLALQDRKSNELLQEQLNALQQQLAQLTPPERAMLRIRAHRRKHELSSSEPPKSNSNKVSCAFVTKLNKSSTRRRGSWATQSKAIAPAPRESISEIMFEGEHLPKKDNLSPEDPPKDDSLSEERELGVTKFVYPGDSFWEISAHERNINGQ